MFLMPISVAISLNLFFVLPSILILNKEFFNSLKEYFFFSIILMLAVWSIISYILFKQQLLFTKSIILKVEILILIISSSFSIIKRKIKYSKTQDLSQNLKKDNYKSPLEIDLKLWVLENSNSLLLIIFLTLYLLFSVFRYPFLPTDDCWFHLSIINEIYNHHSLSNPEIYNGFIYYHYLVSIIPIITGISPFLIVRYIVFVQAPLMFLGLYILTSKLVESNSIKILVLFLFSFSDLGSSLNYTQLWPTAWQLILIISITILLIENISYNYQKEINKEASNPYNPNSIIPNSIIQKKHAFGEKKENYLNSKNTNFNELSLKINNSRKYIIFNLLIVIFSISMMITHITTSFIYQIITILVLLHYSSQNKSYFLELGIFISLFILNNFYNSFIFDLVKNILVTEKISAFFGQSFYYILLILCFSIIVLFTAYFFNKFLTNNTFNLKKKIISIIDEKIIPIKIDKKFRKAISIFFLFISPFIYIVLNTFTKDYLPASLVGIIINTSTIGIIITYSIFGILFYKEYDPKGKFFFTYFFFIFIIVFGMLLVGYPYTFIFRLMNLVIPLLFLGLGYYLSYSSVKWLYKRKNQRIVLSLILLNLCGSLIYQTTLKEHVTNDEFIFTNDIARFMSNRSVNNINDYNNSFINNSIQDGPDYVVFGSFHWRYLFLYNNNSQDFLYFDSYSIIIYYPYLLFNSTAINNSGMTSSDYYRLKKCENKTIFILISDSYSKQGIVELDKGNQGIFTSDQLHFYYNSNNINCVAVGSEERLFMVDNFVFNY